MDDPEKKYVVAVDAGGYVFQQGEAGSCAFVVESGDIVLVHDDGAVSERLGPGDVFGEAALVRDEQRPTAARAESQAVLLRLDRPMFPDLVAAHPELAARIIASLSRRRDRVTALAVPAPASAPATPPTNPRLVHESGAEFPLSCDKAAVVGRSDPRKGFVPEVELSALDTQRSLSRRHARLVCEGNIFYVQEESGVRNGTFVNGRRLSAETRVALKDGDEIAFGLIKTLFRLG